MAKITVPLGLTEAQEQPTSAEVVIIGGGVMGMSIAWHLAERGIKDIVVVEQAEFGSGSSAKPLGGVRANFSDPLNIALGRRSLEEFANFREKFGVDIMLNRVGYLFLGRNEQEKQNLEISVHEQRKQGVNSQMISAQDAAKLNPFLDPKSITAASFSPDDGWAAPSKVVEGYANGAKALGATLLNRTQVLDIQRTGTVIHSVTTNRGEIKANSIICAAGAWSAEIGRLAGVPLPIEAVRRMIGITPQQAKPFPRIPFTLDLSTTLYFHNYQNALLLGISHLEKTGFCREYSYEWLKEFNAAASVFAPGLENPELAEGWAGYYENTPDKNAIIGQSEELPGFFYAAGFSGHGFLQSPAVGEIVADLYQGKESFVDASQFTAERFRTGGSLVSEVNII